MKTKFLEGTTHEFIREGSSLVFWEYNNKKKTKTFAKPARLLTLGISWEIPLRLFLMLSISDIFHIMEHCYGGYHYTAPFCRYKFNSQQQPVVV